MDEDRGSSMPEPEDADEAAPERSVVGGPIAAAFGGVVIEGDAPTDASEPADPVDTVHPAERPD